MFRRSLVAVFVVVVSGCSPKASLIALNEEAAGDHCATGGTRIESGVDANANGTLDASEVSSTSYVCNGAAGPTGSNGTSCTVADSAGVKTISCAGGTQVTVSDGAKGDTGDTGPAGTPGTNGTNGADGASCSATDNGDGTVTFTCGATQVTVTLGTGSGGSAHNSLVSMTPDSSGTCANGGTQVQSGLDLNDNDTLDATEVVSTQYVCNGANGDAGANGTNGTNGTNGHNSLVNLSADSTTCGAAGGTKIEAGIDTNDDGTLSAGEVLNTRSVCNGAAGAKGDAGTNGTNGTNGKNSLLTITNEAAGSNCAAGGKKLQSGLDTDGNGTLDAGEVTITQYVCNGLPASNSVYGNGQDGALTVAAGGLNWVTTPPTGSQQFTNITVNGTWTIPSGMRIRATGTITLATSGSIVVQPSTSGQGIATSSPVLMGDPAVLAGGRGIDRTFASQLFNPGHYGGGVGGGSYSGTVTAGGGGGTIVLLAAGAVSLASGTTINANGGDALQGNSSASSGGGGGGIIVIISNTSITNAGTITASGGKGADYIPAPLLSSPGGGGGGGIIQLAAPSIPTPGTRNVNGGAAGAGSATTGYAGGGGGSGGNGGASGGSTSGTAVAGTTGYSFSTVGPEPAALFLTSTQP